MEFSSFFSLVGGLRNRISARPCFLNLVGAYLVVAESLESRLFRLFAFAALRQEIAWISDDRHFAHDPHHTLATKLKVPGQYREAGSTADFTSTSPGFEPLLTSQLLVRPTTLVHE